MNVTRRELVKLLAIGSAASLTRVPSMAQPRTLPMRLPLQEFVANGRLLRGLRKGVAAMKGRKPSDPLSWFYQASIHGVTEQLWREAASRDPEILKVDRAKFWNQCPHKGENSANFLPWHRGYTHHFEEILRLHTEDEDFALPYWDYSRPDQRVFPREFGVEHLDGSTSNKDPANINPLFHAERDYFLCGYEHPFTDQLPLTELSSRAVDAGRVMNCPVFFGDRESEGVGGGILDSDPSTRGLLEQSPHDQIHRAVGGNVQGTDGQGNPSFALGGMALPPTAGFDPIFPVHHANMDRLWAKWACLPGKSWGKLPDAEWLDERPWFFFDVRGNEVNRPRRDYFDHRALGIRFKDEDLSCNPLQLPARDAVVVAQRIEPFRLTRAETLEVTGTIEASTAEITVIPMIPVSVPVSSAVERFNSFVETVDPRTERVSITFHDAQIDGTGSWGFDVFLTESGDSAQSLSRDSANYLGPLSLFNHPREGFLVDQTFEMSEALVTLDRRSLEGLHFVLVPYRLTSVPRAANIPFNLSAGRLSARGFTITRAIGGVPPGSSHERH